MTVVDDAGAMGLALEAAREAASRGDVPVGAVVLRRGEVIAVAANRREADGDPTAHAEILALRQASELLGTWRLEDCELIVTLEPCAMCAGALLSARVARVVIGAMDDKAGAVGSRYNLLSDPRLNHEVVQSTGLRAEESAAMLRAFFAERR
jgi:tRNA(adenine34) deaminase